MVAMYSNINKQHKKNITSLYCWCPEDSVVHFISFMLTLASVVNQLTCYQNLQYLHGYTGTQLLSRRHFG